MCQHRQPVVKPETGIERYWREQREAEDADKRTGIANAMRGYFPMSCGAAAAQYSSPGNGAQGRGIFGTASGFGMNPYGIGR
jgi:hypothetical protein